MIKNKGAANTLIMIMITDKAFTPLEVNCSLNEPYAPAQIIALKKALILFIACCNGVIEIKKERWTLLKKWISQFL
jgi:hypothetical protein